MRVDRTQLNPIVNKMIDSVLAVKEDIPESMLLMLVNYTMGEVASNLRGKLKLYDGTVKPLNNYTFIFAPSSTGKDLSLSSLNTIAISGFKEIMEKGFNKHKAKYWEQRAMKLVDEDVEDVDAQIKEEQRLVSPFSYRISSGTPAGIAQYRVTCSLYKIGATNLVVDELALSYASMRSLMAMMLSTYEDGSSEARQLKEQGVIAVDGVPSNFLGYSSPALAFDGGTTEKMILEDLEQGMGRRSFCAYVDKPESPEISAIEKVRLSRKKADDNKGVSTEINDYFKTLANPKMMNKEVILSEEAEIALAEYHIACENEVKLTSNISELEKIELLNRSWKATRLAGIYAFISKEDTIGEVHAEQAIYVAKVSGKAFSRVFNQPQLFERCFNFIRSRTKTSEIDLAKQKWYPKSQSQKRELLQLARAFAYENDYLFKIKEVESVEFYSFIPMPKTDVDNITISISKDITKGFKKKKVPFEILHEVVCADGYCYSATQFKNGHRNKKNAIGGQTLAIFDIDDGLKLETAKMMFSNYKCMIATTRNHQKEKNGIVCDRFRIIFIMDRKVSLDAENFARLMRNISEALGLGDIVDTACFDVSRAFFSSI